MSQPVNQMQMPQHYRSYLILPTTPRRAGMGDFPSSPPEWMRALMTYKGSAGLDTPRFRVVREVNDRGPTAKLLSIVEVVLPPPHTRTHTHTHTHARTHTHTHTHTHTRTRTTSKRELLCPRLNIAMQESHHDPRPLCLSHAVCYSHSNDCDATRFCAMWGSNFYDVLRSFRMPVPRLCRFSTKPCSPTTLL
jgi:hypothetical protein